MRSQFTLLDGELISVDAPDVDLGPPVAIGVLYADTTEVEVNAGTPDAAAVFLDVTGTELSSTLQLRGGRTLRVGPLGGDRANGWGYVVEVGDQRLFGPTPPTIGVERLAALLSDTSPARNNRGTVLAPQASVGWSPYRTQGASVVGTLGNGSQFMMDVRRTVPGERRSTRGVQVRGGHLTKQSQQNRDYVILESDAFVVYGLPVPHIEMDDLANAMAEVLVEQR